MPAMTPVQVHEQFERAFNARDIDALMELYEPDAVLIPSRGRRPRDTTRSGRR